MDKVCGRWVASVDRRPGVTLGVVGFFTVIVAAYGILNLGVDSDPRKLINRNLEFQQRQRELTRVFHSFSDGILVVIDADSPTAAGRAADQLAARLAPRTDLYSAIDVPRGGPFYAKNALLYLSVDQLEDLTDRLSKVQPFLAELAEDQSLVGVTDLLRKALVAEREGGATGFDIAEALDRVGGVVQAAADGRRAADPWGSALFGGAVGAEARQRVFQQMKTVALPAFGVEDDLLSMPHSVLVKIQHGGLLGMQRLLDGTGAADVKNIHALVDRANGKYSDLDAVPCPELVPDMTSY